MISSELTLLIDVSSASQFAYVTMRSLGNYARDFCQVTPFVNSLLVYVFLHTSDALTGFPWVLS